MRNKIVSTLIAIAGVVGGAFGGNAALNSPSDTTEVRVDMTACHTEDDCTAHWRDGSWYITVTPH